jgi:hypothetical protein
MAERGGELREALRFLYDELARLVADPAHWHLCGVERDRLASGAGLPRWSQRFIEGAHEDLHGFVAGWAMRQALWSVVKTGCRARLGDPEFRLLVLHVALAAADVAHRAVVDRYGPLRKVSGLHDLKVEQRMGTVVDAWHQAGGDMQATARLANVSPQAAYRFVRRYLGGSAKG